MNNVELFAHVAASATSAPNLPLMMKLAQTGFMVMRRRREQMVAREFEIERIARYRKRPSCGANRQD